MLVLEVINCGRHRFLGQSLLLSTIILNDNQSMLYVPSNNQVIHQLSYCKSTAIVMNIHNNVTRKPCE